jgi:hypothetical protein
MLFFARRQPLAHFLYFPPYPFSRFCAAFEYSKLSGHDARIDESGVLESTASDWFHLSAAVGVDCALPIGFLGNLKWRSV